MPNYIIALLIALPVAAAILSALTVQYLSRRHILAAMEQKAVHLVCSDCHRLVARYQQTKDSTIKCENCLRAIERKIARGL